MSTERIAGNNWRNARLLFDDTAKAEQDALLVLETPNADDGFFEGFFRDRTTLQRLPDELVDGRCTPNGLRPLIVFTRKHPEGTVTSYSGKVIEVANDTTVMIRGRFTRTTTNADGTVALASGDYETEKPT